MTLPEARRVFADLMQQARTGRLTESARKRLAQARQLLRRSKRPAMNPRTTSSKKFRREWAIQYLTDRYNEQELYNSRISLKTYIDANLNVVLRNIKNGLNRRWNREIEGKLINLPHKNPRNPNELCPTCGGTKYSPYRSYDERGRVVQGCVDDFHTGHLTTPSESARWHGRPEARKIRARLKKGRSGKGYSSNPHMVRIGRAVEVRYKRDIGRKPGYYKHEIQSRKAGVYTIPPGWVYVSTKSILITEREPRV